MSAEEQRKSAIDDGFDEPSLARNALPPPITWHTGLTPVLPGRLWTASGATVVGPGAGMYFPATMTIIKEGPHIILVNALRFTDELNDQILALGDGTVHVVRLGAYHGRADGFWMEKCGERGRLWALAAHKMQDGVVAEELRDGCLPCDAQLFEFDLGRPEAVLVLRPEKFAVFCDAVLNINSFQFVSWYARPIILFLGFRSAVNRNDSLYHGWVVKMVGKERVREEYVRMLELDFDSYSSGHGPAMLGGAREKIRDAMKKRLK